jgi:hypothetical protein
MVMNGVSVEVGEVGSGLFHHLSGQTDRNGLTASKCMLCIMHGIVPVISCAVWSHFIM